MPALHTGIANLRIVLVASGVFLLGTQMLVRNHDPTAAIVPNNIVDDCLPQQPQLHKSVAAILTTVADETREAELKSKIQVLESRLEEKENKLARIQSQEENSAATGRSTHTSPRVLLGIFSRDNPESQQDQNYRKNIRKLFNMHPKVCSIGDMKPTCELIYTFVIGGNPSGATELVNASDSILTKYEAHVHYNYDMNYTDITFLNIKENMNEGKSQTWFYYAAQVLQEHNIEYAAKTDVDTLWHLDKYFDWACENLPPAPYNKNILASFFADKYWWNDKIDYKKETWWIQTYGKMIHLYGQGQMYLMSQDLAQGIGHVANAKSKFGGTFLEGHEDHDVTSMASIAASLNGRTSSITMKLIGKREKFWKHPVKISKLGWRRWNKYWLNEMDRLSKVLDGQAEQVPQ